MDALKAVELSVYFKTDQLTVRRKCSLPVDIRQRVQSDNVARFTIQGTEGAKELRLQALGLSLDQNKSR
jgi:hypothetical protein